MGQAVSNSEVLGDVLWLMMRSPIHRQWRVAEIERYVVPALQHGRFRLFRQGPVPVGFVSIATVSDAVDVKLSGGSYLIEPGDWVSGERPWIMDFIAPLGNVLDIRKRLWGDPLLKGKPIKAYRQTRDGGAKRVATFGKYRSRHPCLAQIG